MRQFLTFFLAIFQIVPSYADVFLKPAVMYIQEKNTESGVTETTTRQLIDLSLLFEFHPEWVAGGIYGSEKIRTEQAFTSTETTRTNYGATLGWISSRDLGPFVLANYFFSCQMTQSTLNFKGSTCYQIDFGLKASVQNTSFGAQLSYRSFKYPKYESGGVSNDVDPPTENQYLHPYITVILKF